MTTTSNQPRRGRVTGYPGLVWRRTKHGIVFELKRMQDGIETSNMVRDEHGRPVRDEALAIEAWRQERQASGALLTPGGPRRFRRSQIVSQIEERIERLAAEWGADDARAAVELALSRVLQGQSNQYPQSADPDSAQTL